MQQQDRNIVPDQIMYKYVFQFAREKARELEDYQSVSVGGTDLEGDGEPAVKRRKQEKQVNLVAYNIRKL